MRLDLRHVRIELEPQPLHEPLGERGPVSMGAAHQVCVVVADGARDLAQDGCALDGGELAAQPVHDVRELLAHCRGRRWLPVRV